jgi:RimJ/RimL family protein N-acetyltransferase
MNLKLRNIDITDAYLVLSWRNQQSVIKHTHSQTSVPEQTHMDWFRHRITLQNEEPFYIACLHADPIGFVRFDFVEKSIFQMSVLISNEFQGKGYGSDLIRQGISNLETLHPRSKLRAFVHVDNLASRKLFRSEGFNYVHTEKLFLCFERDLS